MLRQIDFHDVGFRQFWSGNPQLLSTRLLYSMAEQRKRKIIPAYIALRLMFSNDNEARRVLVVKSRQLCFFLLIFFFISFYFCLFINYVVRRGQQYDGGITSKGAHQNQIRIVIHYNRGLHHISWRHE